MDVENRRQSYRCVIPAIRPKCVLRVRNRNWVLELVEESAGGYLIESRRRLPLRVGATAGLRTNRGWTEVRVIHLRKEGSAWRLGLERLYDREDPRAYAQVSAGASNSLRHQYGGHWISRCFITLALAAVVFWGGLIGLSQFAHGRGGQRAPAGVGGMWRFGRQAVREWLANQAADPPGKSPPPAR